MAVLQGFSRQLSRRVSKVISYWLTYSDSLLIGCLSTVLELQKGAVENYVQRDYFLERRIYLSYYSFLFSSGSER